MSGPGERSRRQYYSNTPPHLHTRLVIGIRLRLLRPVVLTEGSVQQPEQIRRDLSLQVASEAISSFRSC